METKFLGYRRENGRVGVRNHVVILPLDDLSNSACEAVANNVKGTLALPHAYGRLQFGADLDLHFRTVGERGGLLNSEALPFRPVLHVFEARVRIQESLHAAVNQWLEPHPDELIMELGLHAWLISVCLGEIALADEVRAAGHVELGVHRDDWETRRQDVPDDFGRMDGVARALDDDIGTVEQFLRRLSEPHVRRHVVDAVERAAGQSDGDLEVIHQSKRGNQAARNESRAHHADANRM